MITIIRKSLAEMVLLLVLGLTCYCGMACGDEEKKIKVEDTTPPVISNANVFDITPTSAQVTWMTDEPAKGEILWGTTDEITKDVKAVLHEEFTTIHRFEMTDLLPSTLYYYWTAGVDAQNNWKISEPATFTTLAE